MSRQAHRFPMNLLTVYLLIVITKAEDQSVPCEFCCPPLFSSSKGIITVRGSSFLLHSISYIIRCLMSTDEVVIVSDGSSTRPVSLTWDRYAEDQSRRRVCTRAENVLVSQISATEFLKSDPGYFQRIVPKVDPTRKANFKAAMAKRINFILISDSVEQMILLIQKVEQELQSLRAGRSFFWQPMVFFLWHIQQIQNTSTKSNIPGEAVLQSLFENHKPYFTIDSGIFFVFIVQKGNSTRSKANLFLSLWECYKLKGKFVIQNVSERTKTNIRSDWNTRSDQGMCNGTVRKASPMLKWMEKVNAYTFLERFLRRDNFMQLPITTSILVTDSTDWIVFKRDINGTLHLVGGSAVEIYKNFQLMMNFSDDVQQGDYVQYLINRNESVTPNQLNSEKADILLNQKSVTPGRGLLYSFLQPTHFGIYQAFFRQPSEDSIRNIVSAPFTIDLWIIMIMTWALIIVSLYICGYISKKVQLCSNEDKEFIQGIGIWAVAVISQKSWYASPSSINYKLIYYISSLTAYVCYAAYSAMIVSFLTVKVVPIQSLDDLIVYNYKFTVYENSEASASLLQEMISEYKLPQQVIKINAENEITHLRERSNAFLAYPDLFYETAYKQNYSENFICTNVYSLPATKMPYQSAMSVRKGSQFRELFSAKLLFIMERGLNSRYKKIYETSRPLNCPTKNYDETKTVVDPVRLTDAFTTFLVILIGWFVAVWVFWTERLLKRRKRVYDMVFLFQ